MVQQSLSDRFKNLLDTAVLEGTDEESARSLASRWQKIDEIPFDFERRRMSVVVAENTEHHQLVCKGALQEILNVCSQVRSQWRDCAAR